MSDIRFEGWLHRSGTGGVYQDSAGNVGIASTQPQQKLDIGNGGFKVGPTGITTITTLNTTNIINATQLSHRNLIINGAMQVAQRGTSSTTSGYGSVDRFGVINTGTDESPTHAQVSVDSGTTPYTLGFRTALKVTNGNQTGGTGTTDYISMRYKFEAQEIANSGWNYTSSSSYITLSFWVKSSVAQNFYGYFYSHDGTAQAYAFETGSLTADTWTKITKTIPGNSNLQFDNNNDNGLDLYISQFWGTDRTDPGKSLNSWAAYAGSARVPDFTSTWYTTNDATFELTGVQFEAGSEATPFEHRSYQDEFLRCCRYYYRLERRFTAAGRGAGSSAFLASVSTPVPLRVQPTLGTGTNSSSESFTIRAYKYDGISDSTATPTVGTGGWAAGNNHITIYQGSHSVTDDRVLNIYMGGGYIDFDSEL